MFRCHYREFWFLNLLAPCKFLVSGDVRGNFKTLFQKIERSIKKCGPFAFLLCTGSFFDNNLDISEWEYFKINPDKVPIQVYILGPNTKEEIKFFSSITKTTSINDKIAFVGPNGIFTTCEGIKVAYTSGMELSNIDENLVNHSTNIKSLLSKGIVDILFASQWPSGITSNGQTDFTPTLPSPLISKLIKTLKPRYCFSGWENHYYERIPLCHADDDGNIELLTRFIGLAYVGNPSQKWLYAVNMEIKRTLSASDANLVNSYLQSQPYEELLESPVPSTSRHTAIQYRSREFKPSKIKSTTKRFQLNCWFCLSSGREHHLIINIGSKVVLSLAKGGLVRDHLCLTPIDHVESISKVNEDIKLELNQYKNSLKQYYLSKKGKSVIFYERNYKTHHAQLNCIAIEKALSSNIKVSFLERASEIGVKMISYSPQSDILKNMPKDHQYFHLELPDGEELLCEISPHSDFPLDFGREALVKKSIFDKPEKASWKNCVLQFDEEKSIVEQIRMEMKFLAYKC